MINEGDKVVFDQEEPKFGIIHAIKVPNIEKSARLKSWIIVQWTQFSVSSGKLIMCNADSVINVIEK